MKIQNKIKKNGFEGPFNPYQISSWLIFFADIILFIIFYLPPLGITVKIMSLIIIGFFIITTVIIAYLATKSDPTDIIVYEERNAKIKNEKYETNLKHFCTICETHVQPRTKHCGKCNRCVHVFDHHCIWLNNCIGGLNYRLFIELILSLFILSVLKIIISIYLLILYYHYTDEYERNMKMFENPEGDYDINHIFVIISLIINSIICLLMIELIGLHLFLYCKKMTTYEYILTKREKNVKIKNNSANNNSSEIRDEEKLTKAKVIININHENHGKSEKLGPKSSSFKDSQLYPEAINHQPSSCCEDIDGIDQKSTSRKRLSGDRSNKHEVLKTLEEDDAGIEQTSKKNSTSTGKECPFQKINKINRLIPLQGLSKVNLELSNEFEEDKSHLAMSKNSISSAIKDNKELKQSIKLSVDKLNSNNITNEMKYHCLNEDSNPFSPTENEMILYKNALGFKKENKICELDNGVNFISAREDRQTLLNNDFKLINVTDINEQNDTRKEKLSLHNTTNDEYLTPKINLHLSDLKILNAKRQEFSSNNSSNLNTSGPLEKPTYIQNNLFQYQQLSFKNAFSQQQFIYY